MEELSTDPSLNRSLHAVDDEPEQGAADQSQDGDPDDAGEAGGETINDSEEDWEDNIPDHVQVLCRVRPSEQWIAPQGLEQPYSLPSPHASDSCVEAGANEESLVFFDRPSGDDIRSYSRAPKTFSFDHVAGETTTQLAIFETIGNPLVRSALQGLNATVFCYGQTGMVMVY